MHPEQPHVTTDPPTAPQNGRAAVPGNRGNAVAALRRDVRPNMLTIPA